MARPSGLEQRRRETGFVRWLAWSGSFSRAAAASGLGARRAFRLLDEDPQVRAVAASVLEERREAAA